MKVRDVVGRRIVAARQARCYREDTHDFVGMHLDALVLDNGTEIRFMVLETGYGYGIAAIVAKPPRRARVSR